jgi:hypothetical protein
MERIMASIVAPRRRSVVGCREAPALRPRARRRQHGYARRGSDDYSADPTTTWPIAAIVGA